MKKATIIVAMAAVLVLALGGTALARGAEPANRSSSYLAKGQSYISWTAAQAKMGAVGLSSDATATAHGNYSTTTVKCQVCHSAHKASATGSKLLQSASGASCVPCHVGATAISSKKVSGGNRHGESTGCTNGYCHAVAPHGAGDISKYATLKTAMLTDHADTLLDAAIQSGVDGAPVSGDIFAAGADKDTATALGSIAVYNPAVTAALLNDVTTAESIALGRAVGTGYVCANSGCHINGAFNSLTADATFGKWDGAITVAADAYQPKYTANDGTTGHLIPEGTYDDTLGWTFVGADGDTYDVRTLLKFRDAPIKGHTLAAVADLTTRDIAFANVGQCSACHDSIDYRISTTTKQFPHGNDVIATDGTDTGKNSSAWFMLKDSVSGAAVATDGRSATNGDLTSGMDGACLKCHRSDATTGVGFDF